MSKLSQRELLTEGFLDTIRNAAKATAKATGAVAGAALGAAKNVGKDLLYMNPNANLFTAAAAGAKQGAKTGYDVAKRATTSLLDMLKEKLKNEYYDKFDFNTIQYGPEEKNQVNKNVTKIPFTAKQTNSNNIDQFYGEIVNTGSGKYNITIKDINGTFIPSRRPASRQGTPAPRQGTPAPTAPATSPGPAVSTKPKFVDALRDWKINNIGPSAATIGINYQQAKSFLKSLNVQDPDRVLSNAGIRDTGTRIISNRQLADIEFTLKSRNLVECTQLDTLQQLKILF